MKRSWIFLNYSVPWPVSLALCQAVRLFMHKNSPASDPSPDCLSACCLIPVRIRKT